MGGFQIAASYKYIIPDIPPSNNRFIGRDVRWKYQQEKKRWAQLIAFTCRPRPDKPLQCAIVSITYYFADKRRRDPDNYSGKMILDGLTSAGILEDDSFDNISLILHGGYDKQRPRTEIEITEETKCT